MDKLPEYTVCFADNPLEADEFVWLTRDLERAEAVLIPRPSPLKVDRTVYLVAATEELITLFASLSNADFKALQLRGLKEFNLRNCGVPGVSMIGALKANGPPR